MYVRLCKQGQVPCAKTRHQHQQGRVNGQAVAATRVAPSEGWAPAALPLEALPLAARQLPAVRRHLEVPQLGVAQPLAPLRRLLQARRRAPAASLPRWWPWTPGGSASRPATTAQARNSEGQRSTTQHNTTQHNTTRHDGRRNKHEGKPII